MYILLAKLELLSEQTTHNGPLVTQILNDILKQDKNFTHYRVGILNEFGYSLL